MQYLKEQRKDLEEQAREYQNLLNSKSKAELKGASQQEIDDYQEAIDQKERQFLDK